MSTEKLVLRKSEWDGVREVSVAALYRNGFYCCLGIHARDHGLFDDELLGYGMPSDLWECAYSSDRTLVDRYLEMWCDEDGSDMPLTQTIARVNDVAIGSIYGTMLCVEIFDLTGKPLPVAPADRVTVEDKVALLRDLFALKGIEVVYRADE